MTCVVSLIDNGKIYMAGDAAGVDQETMSRTKRSDPKVFIKKNMIFAFYGSYRMGQLIRFAFNPPAHKPTKSDHEYLCTDFVKSLLSTFEKNGFDGEDKDNRKEMEGGLLIGYNGNVYEMEGDYQIGTSLDPYSAMGCGVDLAKGSLFTSVKIPNITPEERLILALDAASEYSAGVCPPYTIISL